MEAIFNLERIASKKSQLKRGMSCFPFFQPFGGLSKGRIEQIALGDTAKRRGNPFVGWEGGKEGQSGLSLDRRGEGAAEKSDKSVPPST